MRKFAVLVVLSALALTAPAYAQSSASAVGSDVTAIGKDNVAQAKDQMTTAADRVQKAKDKATGNWTGQAVDSMALGKDHLLSTEKGGETSVDHTILNQDAK